MPQIREQIAMVHLPPSKTLKYLFHVRKTKLTLVEHQGAPSLCFLMVLCWHSRKSRTGLKPARLFLVSKSSISNPFLSKGKLRV